jgi:hypothetical protein
MFRIATWNLKQAVAPKKPLDELWKRAESDLAADVVVFTEAKVPKTGVPTGWTAQWLEGGIGPRRRWGTVIAGRGVELRPIRTVGRWRKRSVGAAWPAAVEAAEVWRNGKCWGAVVGIYGLTTDLGGESVGHGRITVPKMFEDVAAVLDEYEAVVVAGDLNLWPVEKPEVISKLGLVDVVEATASQRPRLSGCSGCSMGSDCGHMWTHRNGNSPNARVQHLDYIFASRSLAATVGSVKGGVNDFPDAWELSDHAPVVADFNTL